MADDIDILTDDNEGKILHNDRPAKDKGARSGTLARNITIINVLVALLITFYYLLVFADLPLFSEARDLWIETAMTTAEHQWLATKLFPIWLIDRVMSKQVVTDEDTLSNPSLLFKSVSKYQQNAAAAGSQGAARGTGSGAGAGAAGSGAAGAETGGPGPGGGAGSLGGMAQEQPGMDGGIGAGQRLPGMGAAQADSDGNPLFPQLDIDSLYNNPGWSKYLPGTDAAAGISVGDKDEFGNTYIVVDEAEDVTIVEVRKGGFVGRILTVPDPSRVVVRNTRRKNVQGELIKSFLDEYDAIAGMNGNGFDDPEGHGKGGVIIGWSVSDGESWGHGSKSEYASVGFNEQDVLMVGIIKDFNKHNIRDLAQYGPTIIVDGKKLISGSGGWGVQPRSAIGQREDGAVLLATFDGRQPGHSLGITAGEVADLFLQYGCLNAGLCDGGSSSIMMYDGQVIGKPSTPMKDTGRYLPNAFLVLKKEPSA